MFFPLVVKRPVGLQRTKGRPRRLRGPFFGSLVRQPFTPYQVSYLVVTFTCSAQEKNASSLANASPDKNDPHKLRRLRGPARTPGQTML